MDNVAQRRAKERGVMMSERAINIYMGNKMHMCYSDSDIICVNLIMV
jgi:hypothetical protein